MSVIPALLRAILISLFAVIAIASNLAHAAAPVPAPVVMHHHQPAGHADHDSPCCVSGTCIGCALPAMAFSAPVTIAALSLVPHPAAALVAQIGFATPPALPPPRA